MRALTIWQPWASMIANGRKPVENRTWKPRAGELRVGDVFAIHAGKTHDYESWVVARAIVRALGHQYEPFGLTARNAPYGALVGVATLDEVRDSPRDRDPWWCGPVGWYLRDARALAQPIECRGGQGLWTVETRELDAMMSQLRVAR